MIDSEVTQRRYQDTGHDRTDAFVQSVRGSGGVSPREKGTKPQQQHDESDTQNLILHNRLLVPSSDLLHLLRVSPPRGNVLTLLPATPVYFNANEAMRYERLRFVSFAVIQLPGGMSATVLANEGYYFDSDSTRMCPRCFSCGQQYGQAHVEDCDRENDNQPFHRSPPYPSDPVVSLPHSQSPQQWQLNMHVIPRPLTSNTDKPVWLTTSHMIMGDDGIAAAGSAIASNQGPVVPADSAGPEPESLGASGEPSDTGSPKSGPEPTARGRCRLCRNELAVILFLPCRHITSCGTCSQRMTTCDVCHQRIESKPCNTNPL
ncbi:hypothetical protein V1264_015543 [Littorina saxatilis]|uniref:RING-type domain-containing protein n=1 Tax=Littorina saxatilis TaxID=31220 RepID=A0AAN9BLP5_9CAEN